MTQRSLSSLSRHARRFVEAGPSLSCGALFLLAGCSSPEVTSVANDPVATDNSATAGSQSSSGSTAATGTTDTTGATTDASGSGTQPTATNTDGAGSASTGSESTSTSTGSTTAPEDTTPTNGAGLGGSNTDDDSASGLMGGGDMGGEGMGGMPGVGGDMGGGDMGGGTVGGGAATPSAGCGGGAQSGTANIAGGIASFPTSYDGSTPIPVVFGFHGAGRTNTDFRTVDARTEGTAFEQNYVMVYLKSNGNDWTSQLQGNVTLFNTAYDEITNNYCVDTSRVFAIGHSSGAQFISNLLCQDEDRLTAVGPVASSRYCMTNPATPTFYIQGRMDQERGGGNGQEVVDAFVASNGCQNMSAPYDVGSCQSGGTMVDPGCVEYQGCSEPMVWCSHNDPNYSNTNHGWPCFANDVLFDFFETF